MSKKEFGYSPTKNLVVIKPDEVKTKTAGGIIVPETVVAKAKPQKGVIIEVGPKCENSKPGDVVIYGKDSGFELEIDGDMYRMMAENDVVLTKKSK